MHSRIIELSTQPISEDERISESDYYDNGFIGNIADYVNGKTNRERDIKWFIAFLKAKDIIVANTDESFTMGENVREKFFKERYEQLKNHMGNMSLEEFCSDSLNVYQFKTYIENKYGFYIHNDGCYETLDNFMRYVLDGQTWYFGGTLDYHF